MNILSQSQLDRCARMRGGYDPEELLEHAMLNGWLREPLTVPLDRMAERRQYNQPITANVAGKPVLRFADTRAAERAGYHRGAILSAITRTVRYRGYWWAWDDKH